MLVVLEGGYNLKSIAKCAEGVVRVLRGENLPVKNSLNKLTIEQMKAAAKPNEPGLKAVEITLEKLKKYWPILDEEKKNLIKKENSKISSESNISGGHQEDFIKKGDRILKKAKPNEVKFYQQLYAEDASPALKEFRALAPEFLGIEEIEGEKFIIMEDLLQNLPNGSLMDIKLGRETYPPHADIEKKTKENEKNQKTTTLELGFRVTGLIRRDKQGNVIEKSTRHDCYFFVTKDNIVEKIRNIFKSNEQESVNKEALEYVQKFVDKCVKKKN